MDPFAVPTVLVVAGNALDCGGFAPGVQMAASVAEVELGRVFLEPAEEGLSFALASAQAGGHPPPVRFPA